MTLTESPHATEAPAPRRPTRRRSSPLGHPLLGVILLVAAYVGLSFLNDPSGYLGTDTGGKVLTLQAMEARGDVGHLDVGYWAEEWDPNGDLHGYWGTNRSTDGAWVQVTTVPMVLAAGPLWDAGGYRSTLALPMLGGVLTALAARALAGRLGGDRRARSLAFWVTGLAGPVLLYALDLWEHTLGLAAMAWATVFLLDAAGDERTSRGRLALAAAAGVLWGVGFSMRTEALLYGAVLTAIVCLDGARRRRWGRAVQVGAASAVGVGIGIAANSLLEQTVLGSTMRNGRAGGAAGVGGSEATTRLREGLITTFGLDAGSTGVVLGIVAVVALGMLVRRAVRPGWTFDRPDVVLGALAVCPVLVGLAGGPAFVPGFLIASPFAVAGIVLGFPASIEHDEQDDRIRLLTIAAIVALPLVWAFQYVGGAGPQWGGRYVLASAFLLSVVGAVRLAGSEAPIRRFVLAAAAVITAFGLTWMVVRTHGFASAGEQLAAMDDPVLIAKDSTGFLPREFVAENGERRWLATLGDDELDRAVEVVGLAGFDRFGVLVPAGATMPDELGGMRRVGVERVPLVSGAALEVVHYAR
ncbi:MAG: hypothetical protein KF906_10665 [Actinobacteria bacterium]|nr:hypothetical protein [Actinomycetota bacterium]